MESYHDDGALADMAQQAQELANAVVGHRITKVEQRMVARWPRDTELVLTLDTGKKVILQPTSDCCARSELLDFIHNADTIDHIITKVLVDDEYERWYILADLHQVMAFRLDWFEGNYPFYPFGFAITVSGNTDERTDR